MSSTPFWSCRRRAALALGALLATGVATAAADPAPARTATERPARAPAKRPVVMVVGDRFAGALAEGLEPDAGVSVARVPGDGLTRPGFADWLGSIRDRLARPDRPALAAVMVGAKDRDALSDASGRFEAGTAGWVAIYGQRVDALAKLFRDAGVPLVWVGLPAVRDPDQSSDFVRQNGIVRDRAAHDGVSYIDSFDNFTDAAGRYSTVGPDAEGTAARLRRADGLGFTRAGARKLAGFLAPDLARLVRRDAEASAADVANLTIERARGFDAALDIDVNAQIRREASRVGGTTLPSASPMSLVSPPAAGPAAGPVLPLTAAPTAPDGQLASLILPTSGPIAADAERPRPGRADDFSWPKP